MRLLNQYIHCSCFLLSTFFRYTNHSSNHVKSKRLTRILSGKNSEIQIKTYIHNHPSGNLGASGFWPSDKSGDRFAADNRGPKTENFIYSSKKNRLRQFFGIGSPQYDETWPYPEAGNKSQYIRPEGIDRSFRMFGFRIK